MNNKNRNIIYWEDYNWNTKWWIVNWNINFSFVSWNKQDWSLKTCNFTKVLSVDSVYTSVDSNIMWCNFNEFKQWNLVTLTIKWDLNWNWSYSDTVDYNNILQSIFKTYYSKTYFDTNIIKKDYLLDWNWIILYNKLPF